MSELFYLCPSCFTEHFVAPDYLNDLNAMHEAEKVALVGLQDTYVEWLERLNKATNSRLWHATAAQRAEAFLRTIGKWTQCSHEIVLYNEEADNFYCQGCKQGMGEEYYHLHKTSQNEPL